MQRHAIPVASHGARIGPNQSRLGPNLSLGSQVTLKMASNGLHGGTLVLYECLRPDKAFTLGPRWLCPLPTALIGSVTLMTGLGLSCRSLMRGEVETGLDALSSTFSSRGRTTGDRMLQLSAAPSPSGLENYSVTRDWSLCVSLGDQRSKPLLSC